MTDQPWVKFYDKGVPASLKPYPEIALFKFLEDNAAKYPDDTGDPLQALASGVCQEQTDLCRVE